jgi:cyclase
MPQTQGTLPTTEHFKIEKLAEGAYAALGRAGGAAYSNAGIIDLGDQTLIFDTFNTPQAGKELRTAAEQLTGRPANYVIISHAHADHWCGNQAFDPHTPIITTHKTRETMPGATDWLRGYKKDPAALEKQIQEDQKRLETETDPRWRASIERSIAGMRHTLEALPTLELRLPNWTFDGRLDFHGSQRTAELITSGPGHTPSDATLVLPAEGIMFMGDLGFFQCQPFMVFCEPAAWTAQLEQMEGSEIEVFVPGHGPLGTKADLALQRRYITLLDELVIKIIKQGGSAEQAVQQVQAALPAPFDGWLEGGMARYEANVWSAHERLSATVEAA